MPTDASNYIESSNRIFAASTVLSTLVHVAVFVSLILVMEHSTSMGGDVAKDIELELVGSGVDQTDSVQQELYTDQAKESIDEGKVATQVPPVHDENAESVPVMAAVEQLVTSEDSDELVAVAEQAVAIETSVVLQSAAKPPVNVQTIEAAAVNTLDDAQDVDTRIVDEQLLKLLHSRISDKKQYPYFAKRQRREGVATVSFVLHPNGDIEDARLVNSSHTELLDRAALSAVEKIEPFEAARDYLETAETFKIDVVFELL